MASSSSTITSLAGNFGRLWRRGHESFAPESRRILSVTGAGATTYLQGLVTSDLLSAPTAPREEEEPDYEDAVGLSNPPPVEFSEKLRSTCFLDNKGRIVTDSLLWKLDDTHYLIDVPGDMADTLYQHLKQFVLRKTKVKVKQEDDNMSAHVVYGTLNAHGTPKGYIAGVDPRHPSLGMRILSLEKNNNNSNNNNLLSRMSQQFPEAIGTYDVLRKLAGVAEGKELHGKIAIESNQEFLNAVSFQKGCYLGQELTARVQYTGAVRKRIMPIFMLDTNMQIPPPWLLASQLQKAAAAKKKEEETKDGVNDNDDEAAANTTTGPRLPRLSPTAAGAIVGMISGDEGNPQQPPSDESSSSSSSLHDLSQLKAQSEAMMERLQTSLSRGDKIKDVKDGKTIGQIIATPELGTNVVLAQMRLDRVGLLGDGVWTHTNKIVIGDGDDQQEFRYLPYLPLWWPEIDRKSGKAVE